MRNEAVRYRRADNKVTLDSIKYRGVTITSALRKQSELEALVSIVDQLPAPVLRQMTWLGTRGDRPGSLIVDVRDFHHAELIGEIIADAAMAVWSRVHVMVVDEDRHIEVEAGAKRIAH
jgi:hypothetical protein